MSARLTPEQIAFCINEKYMPTSQPVMSEAWSSLTQAAVLLPLIPHHEEWRVLFIRRTLTVSHHQGQIAFPGGRSELHDQNMLATALRETREELGVDTRLIHILGKLPPTPTTRTGFLIHPFVGVLPMEVHWQPDPREVAEILTLPLRIFLETSLDLRRKGCYPYHNEIIWGATARIMTLLTDCLLTEPACVS